MVEEKVKTPNEFRFQPDANCLPICTDEIFYFMNGFYGEINVIGNLKRTREAVDYLAGNGFRTLTYMPFYFILTPIFFSFLLRGRYITFSKKKFQSSVRNFKKKCILHFTTAHKLYNIEDNWTHYIAELFNESERVYIDSYLQEVQNLNSCYQHFDPLDLQDKTFVKILIFRQ